jgi:hypothetical protein
MAKPFLSCVVMIVALVLADSCTSTGPGGASAIPSDLRVMVGDGGGFSGLWTGFTITAGDSVYRWTGRFPGDNAAFYGFLPADSLRALWRTIESSRLLDSSSTDAQANVVHTLNVRALGRERSFAWGETPSPGGASASAYSMVVRIRSILAQRLQK